MRIFLIDYENVHSDGMVGVDMLSEDDEVVIFYSLNADTLTFELLHKLMFCKAKLSYYKIKRGGRNALDFQLSTYLGYLADSRPDAEFYIISRDNGYDYAIDFWESGYLDVKPKVRRFPGIRQMLTFTARAAQPVQAPQIVEVRVELPIPIIAPENEPVSEDDPEVEKLLEESASPHELYIKAVKKFGQKKGVEVYRNIKARFAKTKVKDEKTG